MHFLSRGEKREGLGYFPSFVTNMMDTTNRNSDVCIDELRRLIHTSNSFGTQLQHNVYINIQYICGSALIESYGKSNKIQFTFININV